MNKKIITIVFVVGIIILSLVIFANLNSVDDKILEQTFVIGAVYFENDGYIEISFHDKSNKTKHITLEILGMPESFHKEYVAQQFEEHIQFASAPKYGWQSIPVIFLVDHDEYGNIGIKTEIRPNGEIPAKIIFSKGL